MKTIDADAYAPPSEDLQAMGHLGYMRGDLTLRELQTALPWTVRYSTDFRSNPQAHKDFAHSLVHVTKALGQLAGLIDGMDHDKSVADGGEALRKEWEGKVADFVIGALRCANTFPGGIIDLQRVVEDRLETKNNIKLPRNRQ